MCCCFFCILQILTPPLQKAAVAQAHGVSRWHTHKRTHLMLGSGGIMASWDAWRPHRCKQTAHHDFGEYRMFWQLENHNGVSEMLWITVQQCNHRTQLNPISLNNHFLNLGQSRNKPMRQMNDPSGYGTGTHFLLQLTLKRGAITDPTVSPLRSIWWGLSAISSFTSAETLLKLKNFTLKSSIISPQKKNHPMFKGFEC